MKSLVLAVTLILPTSAFAQQQADVELAPMNSNPPAVTWNEATPQRLPDFGYVVYDKAGKPAKAFGPNTPVERENGSIGIVGADIPAGWTVQTEDAPTYLKALATVSGGETVPDSDYTQEIREVLASINEGAAIVKDTLCKNPSRPSLIRVEVAGGFSLGVYGSLKSTVDWDLDKICPVAAASAQ